MSESTPTDRTSQPRRRWRIRVLKLLIVMFVPALIAYGWLAVRFYTSEPNPTRDFLAEFNAPIDAADPDDLAWPVYRQAMLSLGEAPLITTIQPPHPGDADWDSVETYLLRHQAILALAHEASQRPLWGRRYGYVVPPEDQQVWPFPPREEPPEGFSLIGEMDQRYLATMRGFAKLIETDLLRAASSGEVDIVIRDAQTLIGIAEHIRSLPFMMDQLIGGAIFALAVEAVGRALHEYNLDRDATDAQLEQLMRAFERFGAGATLQCDLTGEQAVLEDMLQRVYSDDGSGDGRFTWRGFKFLSSIATGTTYADVIDRITLPLTATRFASRRELSEFLSSLFADLSDAATAPYSSRDFSPFIARMNAVPESSLLSRIFLTRATTILDGTLASFDRMSMERDGMIAIIAAHRFRLQHDVWPETLDALVGPYLSQVPIDQFTGEPLDYQMIAGIPNLYGSEPARQLPPVFDGSKPSLSSSPLINAMKRAHQERQFHSQWAIYPPPPAEELDPVDAYDPQARQPAFWFPWFDVDG